jgi:hypothetical protein
MGGGTGLPLLRFDPHTRSHRATGHASPGAARLAAAPATAPPLTARTHPTAEPFPSKLPFYARAAGMREGVERVAVSGWLALGP